MSFQTSWEMSNLSQWFKAVNISNYLTTSLKTGKAFTDILKVEFAADVDDSEF